MSITDADQLIEVQQRLVEDASLSSGLFTLSEISALFNQRQNRFNADTFLLLAHETILASLGVDTYDLPDEWIATQRVTWRTPTPGATGPATAVRVSPVTAMDRFGVSALLSLSASGPPLPTRPIIYDDTSAGIGVIEVVPPPLTDGVLDVLYAPVLEVLNFNSAAPDTFDLPDDFVPYITYGVLADLLSKEGRGRDLARSAYCEARYQEGVAVAALFLRGFTA